MNERGTGSERIRLAVNGASVEAPAGISGAGLLELLDIPASTAVAEVNGQHLPRSRFLQHRFVDGDVVELVSLVGGG
jgi:thiamine biosynthesis protein ThiS